MQRDKEVTSEIMRSIKSKNTRPELILGKALWSKGYRYRKHYKIRGKPDFVFVSKKVAIFCDGDFWHDNNWRLRNLPSLEAELDSYSHFWANKIKCNIERDKEVNFQLKREGWTVLRFWESEIKKNIEEVIRTVSYYL